MFIFINCICTYAISAYAHMQQPHMHICNNRICTYATSTYAHIPYNNIYMFSAAVNFDALHAFFFKLHL